MGTAQFENYFLDLNGAAKQFGWTPTPGFCGRLVRFAGSVGKSNVEDLFALTSFFAWERFQNQPEQLKRDPSEFERAILRDLDRERKRWQRAAVRIASISDVETTADSNEDPALQAMTAEAGNRLRSAIQSLSPGDQHLLALRFGHGMNYQQMAQLGATSISAMRVRLFRIIRRLRSALDHQHNVESARGTHGAQ